MTDELTCPKCQGAMRRYERNGIHIDQCAECRGVFLDRGELEHLIDAEASFSQPRQETPAPPPPAPQVGSPSGWSQPQPAYGYDQGRQRDRGYSGHRPKRRKSFLEEIFD
jgi:Zn-finger nucleic acid-binding protein